MRVLLRLVGLTAGLVVTAVPGLADDQILIPARLRTAVNGVSSFVVELRLTNVRGVGANYTFVMPNSAKGELRFGQTSVESYAIDGMVYVHVPDGGWQKTKFDGSAAPVNYLKIIESPDITLLPDRRVKRITVGVFAARALLPETLAPSAHLVSQPIVCAYDKASYLIQTCTTASVTMTFGKYNDPGNVVTLPDAAKNAVLVVHRLPPADAPASSEPVASPSSAPSASSSLHVPAPAPAGPPSPSPSPPN